MIRTGKLDLSPTNRKPRKTDGTAHLHKIMILSPESGEALTPNAFLIDQAPQSTIRTHFHTNCQFQVFAGGVGHLGRRPIEPFIVQYVAGHNGYGPIVAGETGLLYFTLRPSEQAGAIFLPDQRDRLDRTARKYQMTSETFPPGSANAEHPVIEMLAPQDDGLAAWMMYVEPGATRMAPHHANGVARYYLVTRGEMIVNGVQLPPYSMAWTAGSDLDIPVQAGADGLELICMQFPQDAY